MDIQNSRDFSFAKLKSRTLQQAWRAGLGVCPWYYSLLILYAVRYNKTLIVWIFGQ